MQVLGSSLTQDWKHYCVLGLCEFAIGFMNLYRSKAFRLLIFSLIYMKNHCLLHEVTIGVKETLAQPLLNFM